MADSSRFGCQGGDDLFSESFWDLFQQLHFLFSPNFDFLVCNLCLFFGTSYPRPNVCTLRSGHKKLFDPATRQQSDTGSLLGTLVLFHCFLLIRSLLLFAFPSDRFSALLVHCESRHPDIVGAEAQENPELFQPRVKFPQPDRPRTCNRVAKVAVALVQCIR